MPDKSLHQLSTTELSDLVGRCISEATSIPKIRDNLTEQGLNGDEASITFGRHYQEEGHETNVMTILTATVEVPGPRGELISV